MESSYIVLVLTHKERAPVICFVANLYVYLVLIWLRRSAKKKTDDVCMSSDTINVWTA